MIKVLRRLFVIKVIFLFTLTFFLVNSHIGEFNPIYRTLYDVWYNLLSTLTKISSLNFGDLFYLILLFIFFYFLIKRNKLRRRDYILRLILFVMVIYNSFYWSWGFNYQYPINSKQTTLDYNSSDLKETLDYYLKKTNQYHLQITKSKNKTVETDLTFNEISEMCTSYFTRNTQFKDFKVNKSYFSEIISYLGFTGYINPITLESNINYNIPVISLPTTISHEIAHQIGYSSESEANYYAIKSTISNKNNFIKYSGSLLALQYIISELQYTDSDYLKLKLSEINKGVIENIEEKRKFNLKYKNPIEPYIKKLYDIFLKKNNQVYGIRSYNMVVNLLIEDYYQSKIKTSKLDSNWFLSLDIFFSILSNSFVKFWSINFAFSKLFICIVVGP